MPITWEPDFSQTWSFHSQNHKANYGTSFKVQKVMLPSLKYLIFRFWSKFVLFTQLSRQQNRIFRNLALSLFSIYDNISSFKKLRKSTEWTQGKMRCRWINRPTDGQKNRIDFTGSLPQRWRFNHIFQIFENKILKIIWLDCEAYGKNQYKKKEYSQHSSVFKEFKNNDP